MEKGKKDFLSDPRSSFKNRYSMAREGNCYRRSQHTYACTDNYYLQSTRPLVKFSVFRISPRNKNNNTTTGVGTFS